MADFTLNAPGTVNSPWSPANVIEVVSTIKSDATGWRASTAGVFSSYAHNVTYGSTITATATVAAGATSNGDEVWLGAVVRSGTNAGAGIGIARTFSTIHIQSWDKTGTVTNVSADVTNTRTTSEVISCTVTIATGTATITASINGTPITFSANTTTAFAGEASLAAGSAFLPNNTNALYLSQFTGTGVLSGSFTLTAAAGAYAMTGQAATLSMGASFILFANAGTYNYVGAPANSSYQLDSASGIYVLSGQIATLSTGGSVGSFVLVADTGVYALLPGTALLSIGTAPPIATPQCITNFEIISDAYQLIGVIDENSSPSNEQGVTALSVLNDYLLNEAADGMRLGWFRQFSLQACTPLRDEDIYGVKILLALQLAARYGITVQNAQLLEAGVVVKTQLVKRSLLYSESDFSELSRPQGGPWGGPNWI